MKKLLFFTLSLVNMFAVYQIGTYSLPVHDQARAQGALPEHSIILRKASRQTNLIITHLLDSLDHIFKTIDYWDKEKTISWTLASAYNRQSVIARQQEIQEKLNFLYQERDQISYYIGRLLYNYQKLNTLINTAEFFPKMFVHLTLISQCLSHTLEHTPIKEPLALTSKDLLNLYQSNQEKLEKWLSQFYNRIAPYTIPSHLQRHAPLYALGAAGTLGTLCYLYINPTCIDSLVGTLTFPLQKYYEAIDAINVVDYKESASLFASLWNNDLKKRYPELSEQKREELINHALNNGNSPLLYNDWKTQLEHPVYNASQLFTLLNVRVQLWEYVAYKCLGKAQEVAKKIFKFTPFALGAAASLYIGKKIVNLLVSSNKSHKEIHTILHRIHLTLNTIRPSHDMELFVYYGTLIYLTEELKKHVFAIDPAFRLAFINDSMLLASFDSTPRQKLQLIEQLYRHSSWQKNSR